MPSLIERVRQEGPRRLDVLCNICACIEFGIKGLKVVEHGKAPDGSKCANENIEPSICPRCGQGLCPKCKTGHIGQGYGLAGGGIGVYEFCTGTGECDSGNMGDDDGCDYFDKTQDSDEESEPG